MTFSRAVCRSMASISDFHARLADSPADDVASRRLAQHSVGAGEAGPRRALGRTDVEGVVDPVAGGKKIFEGRIVGPQPVLGAARYGQDVAVGRVVDTDPELGVEALGAFPGGLAVVH